MPTPASNPNLAHQTVERIQLPNLLDDFRTALEEEIDAASRNSSSSAIPLIDGKLVGKAAQSFQYAFKLETVLNTPGDTPGELVIPHRPRVPLTIVSIEGLKVVVSVEENLSGFVPKAWLRTDLSFLMKKLVSRIEDKAELRNPAAERMMGVAPISGSPADISYREGQSQTLDKGQKAAVESSIGRNFSAIWGPPGTGKTTIIGEIVMNLFRANRSVLIVSHTNTAVDQAILKAANSEGMAEHLPRGAVVRVGQVANKELLNLYPDALIKTQIDRKSEGLLLEREKLTEEKRQLELEVHGLRIEIEMCEWVTVGKVELKRLETASDLADKTDTSLRELVSKKDKSTEAREKLKKEHRKLFRLLELRKELNVKTREFTSFQNEMHSLTSKISLLENSIKIQARRTAIAERIQPLRQERKAYPSPAEQRRIVTTLHDVLSKQESDARAFKDELGKQQATLLVARRSNALMRAFKRMPDPETQKQKVVELTNKVNTLDTGIAVRKVEIEAHERKLARIKELDSELLQHNSVGTRVEEYERKVAGEKDLVVARNCHEQAKSALLATEASLADLHREVKELGFFPSDLNKDYCEVCEELHQLSKLPELISDAHSAATDAQQKYVNLLDGYLRATERFLEFDFDVSLSRGVALEQCSEIFTRIEIFAQTKNVHALANLVGEKEARIHTIDQRGTEIDEKLAMIERFVIHEAKILGATLTKTYLSDSIQERTFDTVILDEASMAPIPALWMAASLAEQNLIIVGDFKQLPPICISSHAIAKKWLGRDIFEVSGLQAAYENENEPSHFIQLTQQFRMRREIADVANLFYEGKLRSDSAPGKKDEADLKWLNPGWANDTSPVSFVDTSELNAWVTSIPKGDGASRLNFLTATLCVDLAEQVLAPDRNMPDGGERRVLIVSPYQPHSKLIRLMVEQNKNICNEVESGTVHSFQGSEADVVIFDLVLDEPHWRANLFYPLADDSNKRIYNVAMTRAKHRLIIVGNFEWCSNRGNKVFLGKKLLPFIKKNYPVFSAKELIPNGLAGRAARAQLAMLGGAVEASSERLILNQSEFFQVIGYDIQNAKYQIIILSAFLTQNRVSFLLPQLQATIERGVAVYVVTKSHSDRKKTELRNVRELEQLLQDVGVFVMHKKGMHEKVVLIDDDITWSGSLNPLSFSNTQEIMERRFSKVVQRDFREILRIEELIGVCGQQESVCPICDAAMMACEGNGDPFYWRCESDDCQYSRNIGVPYPTDGLMRCKTCEGDLEFGEWGGKYAWRCTKNRQHRMTIYKSHLRLPRMVELIPMRQRGKVFQDFGLKCGPDPGKAAPWQQGTLF